MNSLISIAGTWIWFALVISAIILFFGALSSVYRSLHDNRNKAHFGVAVLNLVIISVLLVLLMDCAQFMDCREEYPYYRFQLAVFNLPYPVYVLVLLLSCVLLLAQGFEGSNYRAHNIVSDTIQQAIDVLPEGIAICTLDGTVCLSNIRINTLCRTLTGKLMSDGSGFWRHVETRGMKQGGQFIVRLTDNEVWLLAKERLSVKGMEYDQITAANISERYKIIEELENKNEHLQDIRRRMKAVSELSGDMFIAQEEADARAALHNQLGQVLLMDRHYINHRDITDPDIVYAATMQMNRFLLGEAQEPYKGEDDYSQSIAMANSIGVNVIVDGNEPENKDIRKILAQAIVECAANTVKHAEGDTVNVCIKIESEATQIIITNNGKQPAGVITESGGLLSLRKNAEALGGTMVLESENGFVLKLSF